MARNRNIIDLGLNESGLLQEWKKRVGIELWHFVQRNSPLAHGKPSGRTFYIDSDSLVNALLLTGRRLYADEVRGFSAPINKREPTLPHPVQIYDGVWRMVGTKTKFGRPGVYIHDVDYHGRKIVNGFFGVKRNGEIRAYGIDQDSKALPAYSFSIPEWVLNEQSEELSRIINEAFESVFKRQLKAS